MQEKIDRYKYDEQETITAFEASKNLAIAICVQSIEEFKHLICDVRIIYQEINPKRKLKGQKLYEKAYRLMHQYENAVTILRFVYSEKWNMFTTVDNAVVGDYMDGELLSVKPYYLFAKNIWDNRAQERQKEIFKGEIKDGQQKADRKKKRNRKYY